MVQSPASGTSHIPLFYENVLSHPPYVHNPCYGVGAGKFDMGERAQANCNEEAAICESKRPAYRSPPPPKPTFNPSDAWY